MWLNYYWNKTDTMLINIAMLIFKDAMLIAATRERHLFIRGATATVYGQAAVKNWQNWYISPLQSKKTLWEFRQSVGWQISLTTAEPHFSAHHSLSRVPRGETKTRSVNWKRRGRRRPAFGFDSQLSGLLCLLYSHSSAASVPPSPRLFSLVSVHHSVHRR